jgi:hypothetical protein
MNKDLNMIKLVLQSSDISTFTFKTEHMRTKVVELGV